MFGGPFRYLNRRAIYPTQTSARPGSGIFPSSTQTFRLLFVLHVQVVLWNADMPSETPACGFLAYPGLVSALSWFGISSAGICTRSVCPLYASNCARLFTAAIRDLSERFPRSVSAASSRPAPPSLFSLASSLSRASVSDVRLISPSKAIYVEAEK